MTRQLSPGDHFGRYRIDGVLGRGGMGEVYLAYDAQLRRKVALKILLRGDEAHDSESSERLLREARAAAAIEHPNAVQVFDVDEVGDTPFMAMELVEGRPLRTYVTDETIPVATKIIWLTEIARALHAAHLRGVVHRDVKPENVIIRADGVVKVLDFGTARRVDMRPIASDGVSPMAMTSTDSPAVADAPTDRPMEGTLLYMAPEQVRGEEIDGLVDQWAWGILAYELLAGVRPWDGSRGGVAILSQILSSDPPELASRARGISDGMSEVVLRALRKPKHERFGSLALAADALEAQTPIPLEEVQTGGASAWSSSLAAVALISCAFWMIGSTPMAHPKLQDTTTNATTAAEISPPDYGSPMSSNAIALDAYRSAVQGLRDGASTTTIMVSLDQARAADPDFAAAYLRELIAEESIEAPVRDLFDEALKRRDRLGEHDRALLAAVEPLFRIPLNREELRRRFAELANRGDADYDLQRCFFMLRIRDFSSAREACRDAANDDPSLAAAHLGRALSLRVTDNSDGERTAYDACLARAPNSGRCLEGLARLAFDRGQCDEYASLIHRIVFLSPDDINAHALESVAIYAQEARAGTNLSRYRAAADDATNRMEPGVKDLFHLTSVAAQSIAEGHLKEAVGAYDALARIFLAVGDETFIRETYRLELELLLELRHTDRAIALSQRWLRERAAWSPSPGEDSRIMPFVALYVSGATGRETFLEERRRWIGSEESRGTATSSTTRWVDAYASALATPDDVSDALAALQELGPAPAAGQAADVDLAIGRVSIASGQYETAVPRLRAASVSCPDAAHPLPQLEALSLLAVALANTGDRVGACAALEALLHRWGDVRSSRSVIRSRTLSSDLRCSNAATQP